MKTLASIKFNIEAARSDRKRDAGLTTPDDITRIDNIVYGRNPKIQTLDIYYPKGTDRPLPVIVNVHGGGYVYGSTKVYQFYCMNLAQRGFTVVSFNYHLAPDCKFPSPLKDLNIVMKWMIRHREEYFMDLRRVLLFGDSAGAQLASQYAVIATNPEYAEIMGIRPSKIRFSGLGLNCGMYDLPKILFSKNESRSLLRNYFTGNPRKWGEMLNVTDYITKDYPPVYLMTSEGDFLKEHCRPMYDLLIDRGVPATYKIYGDESTLHVFHVDIKTELAKTANDEEIQYLSRFFP
ncbi:MAG: alpha/beta hydrolase [Eubacterium sp.]|nr:alpha/beta hydrolase [Eubacterium sp.]